MLYCGKAAGPQAKDVAAGNGRRGGSDGEAMKCPYCGYDDSRVTDSRDQGEYIQRRRRCERCEQRFSTVERVVLPTLMVVKRDGRREPFKREKLLTGLRLACQKRPIPVGELEAIVEGVESALHKLGQAEVDSRVVGELVMERLRALDDIAYIRFASVYRSYPDIQAMRQEMDHLLTPKAGAQARGEGAREEAAARGGRGADGKGGK